MNPFTESTVARPLLESTDAHNPVPPEGAVSWSRDETPSHSQPAASGPTAVSAAQAASSCALASSPPVVRPSARAAGTRLARRSGGQHASGHLGGLRAMCKRFRPAAFLLAAGLNLALPGFAAAVDVNAATAEQLLSVRGIGPKTAQIIVDERMRGGRYESFADLSDRVKGIGPKKSAALQASGLTLGKGGGTTAASGRTAPSSARANAK